MSTIKTWTVSSIVILASGLFSTAVLARAGTDMSEMTDEIRALIAKERARQLKPTDKDIERFDKTGNVKSSRSGNTEFHKGGVKGGCDMDIGNDQPRPGQINAKPKTVVITGPVIQNCK